MIIFGLDLGQAADYTAIAGLEAVERKGKQPEYRLRHLERMPLRTPYPEIVERVRALLVLAPESQLVVDSTGVGRPVVDLFRHHDVYPVAVTITAGAAQTHDAQTNEWHVPKRALVSTLQVLLQSGRLKIAKRLPAAQALVTELTNFKFRMTQSAHLTFDAKSGEHDDLVIAVALAAWRAMRMMGDSFSEPEHKSDPGEIVEAKHLEWLQASRREDEWL